MKSFSFFHLTWHLPWLGPLTWFAAESRDSLRGRNWGSAPVVTPSSSQSYTASYTRVTHHPPAHHHRPIVGLSIVIIFKGLRFAMIFTQIWLAFIHYYGMKIFILFVKIFFIMFYYIFDFTFLCFWNWWSSLARSLFINFVPKVLFEFSANNPGFKTGGAI